MDPEDKIIFLFENAVKIATAMHVQDNNQNLTIESQGKKISKLIDIAYTTLEENLNSRIKDLPRSRSVPLRRL